MRTIIIIIIIIQRHPIDRWVIEIYARIRPLASLNAFPGLFLNSSRDPFIFLPSTLSVTRPKPALPRQVGKWAQSQRRTCMTFFRPFVKTGRKVLFILLPQQRSIPTLLLLRFVHRTPSYCRKVSQWQYKMICI